MTHPDDLAFKTLAKAAQQHDEPAFKRSLLTAWATARHSISLPDLKTACREHDWAKAADLVGRGKLKFHVHSAIGGQVAAAFLRGVDHGKRPLRRLVQRDITDRDLRRMSPYAREWAATRAGDLVDAPADVQRRIREIVLQAVDDDGLMVDEAADLIYDAIGLDPRRATALANYAGQLPDDLAADVVQERLASYSALLLDARAEMIARTELMMATNAGQHAMWQVAREDGMLVGMQRMWIVTDDPICCDECQAIAEAGPVGMDEAFAGEVEFPPLHPNCRCTVGLVNMGDHEETDDA